MKNILQITSFVSLLVWQVSVSAQTYCTAGPSSTFDSEITNVAIIGDNFGISNLLTCPGVTGVQDFTATDSVDMSQGTSYTLFITFGTCGGIYTSAGEAWIDFNNDGDFTDAGESIGTWTGSPEPQNSTTYNATFNFSVPTGATLGETRMRIMHWEGGSLPLNSCGTFTWGAIEDYKVVVTNTPPPCPIPGSITSTPAATSATINWISTGTLFDIEYGPIGFTVGTGTSTTSTTTSVTLSNLTANTGYDVYVRNNCTASGNGQSGWSFAHTFFTTCTAVSTFPFTENFDGSTWVPSLFFLPWPSTIDACWSRTPDVTSFGTFGWVPATGASYGFNTGPNADKSGTGQYIYAFSDGGGSPDTALLVTPPMDLTGLTTPLLTFWHHMFGASMGDLIIQASTNGSTWTTVYTISGQQQTAATDNWIETIIDITAYKSTNAQIRFLAAKSSFGGSDMAIDEVSVAEAPPCPKPTAVSLSNITSSSVDVNFVSNGVSFPIEWGPVGYVQGTGALDTATASGHTITGLAANTEYDLYILNDCSGAGNGLSAWAGPFTFRTLCNAFAEGYFQNFDALSSGDKEPCWFDLSLGGTSTHTVNTLAPPAFSNVQPFSVPNLLFWNNAGAGLSLVVTPELLGLDGDTSQVRFRMTHNSFSATPAINVWVGTMSDRTDASTIVWTDTITPAQYVWNQYTILLDNVPAGHKFVVFGRDNSVTFTEVDIDDFYFEGIPQCLPPTAHNIVIADLDSISLTWSGGANAFSNIEYGPCGFTQGTGSTVNGATNGAATLNNLTSGTCYDIYIQNDCGNGVVSPWYGPIQVSTQVCAVANQCSYQFIMEDSFGDGWNGALIDIVQNGVVIGTIGSTFITGNWDTAFVPVCDALNTDIVVQNQGSFAFEVGLEIIDPFGISVYNLATGTGITTGQTLTTFLSGCTPPSCPDPINLAANTITGFTANLNWSAIGTNHIEYYVEYGPQGFGQGSGIFDTTQTTSLGISGLAPQTCYDYYVIGDCGTNGTSAWVGPFNFCTTVSCPAPTNVRDSAKTANSIIIKWNTGSSSDWNVSWGPAGTAAGGGTSLNVSGTPELALAGLTDCTPYTFWVRDSCGPNDISVWTGPYNFTTAALTQSLPFVESFNFGLGCWEVIDGGSTSDTWYGATTYGTQTLDGTPFGFVDSDGAGSGAGLLQEELISPPIDASGTLNLPLTLDFDQYYNNIGADSAMVDVWDGNQWVTVLKQTTDAGSWATPDHQTINISAYANANLKVRFRYNDASLWAWYWAIDNVVITDAPTCPAPTALGATNIATTTADLSWTTGGANNWNVEYGPAGFVPGSGTVITNASNPYTLTGLNASTCYDFYVQDSCGVGDVSLWAGPFTFCTACGVVTAPFSESFNTPGTEPQCWTNSNVQGNTSANAFWKNTSLNWPNYGAQGVVDHTGGTSYAMGVDASTPYNVDVELVTPFIDISSLGNPELKFWIYMNNTNTPGAHNDFQVDLYDGSTWNDSIFSYANDSSDWVEVTVPLSGYTITGPIQVRFAVYKVGAPVNFYDDILIDDITIDGAGGCPAPTNFGSTSIGCDSVVVSWNSDPATILSGVLYGPAGFNPQTGGTLILPATSPLTISGLSPGTGYDMYLTDSCAAGLSIPDLLSVTTPSGPQPGIAFSVNQVNTTATTADVEFDATASSNYTSLTWDFGGGNTSTNVVATNTYTMNQTYSVTLTLTSGCGQVDSTFDVTVTGIGIDESELARSLNIFPNPSAGAFAVDFTLEGSESVTINVLDPIGRLVAKKELGNVDGAQHVTFDLDNQASGVYLVQIVTDSGTLTRRITIRSK